MGGRWAIDGRTPAGINLAGGAVAVVVAAVVAAAVPPLRFVAIPTVVGGFAAITGDQLALAGVVLLGWLTTNGFLENREGELSWHHDTDIRFLMIFVVVAAIGLATGECYRQVRELRARYHAVEELTKEEAPRG
jgi:MFS family permease